MPGVVLTGKSLKRNGQMKSNRILLLVLLALIIVFGAVAGYLYTANNAENKNQTQLKNNIAKDLATINKGIAQKADLDKAAADIASQLDAAKAALADINFRKAAESIEYDRILYGIADASSATYIGSVVTKILDFTNKIAVSSDFDTAVIESVNINEPHPMTSEEIQGLIDGINNKIADGIRGQIDALTSQIQTDNEDTLTQEQINALIKTDTDKLVAATLAAKTPDEIKTLVDQAGIARPTAVITISIWTYKGA